MNEKFRSALFVGLVCLVVCSKFGQLVEGVTSPFGFNSNQSKHEKNSNSDEKCFCKVILKNNTQLYIIILISTRLLLSYIFC